MPQTPVDNTQASLALTQAFVMSGVFPPRDGGAGGAFLDEIFTFAFNFAPGSPNGTLSANGQLLPIVQHTAVFSLIGTTYGGNGTTNFALPDLGGVTMIGTGQGPGLSPEQLGVRDGTSSVTLTSSELPPDLGGTSQPFNDYQPSLPVTYMICVAGIFPSQGGGGALQDMIGEVMPFAGNFVPTDYVPADGRLLSISQYETLFALIGTTYGGDGNTTFALPDLRGRTIIGASTADPLGTLVGSPTVSLSNNQTPNGFNNAVQPFDNREPSLALNYLIALSGIFPSRDSGSVDPNTPFLGEVMPFAGTFAPSGWALANGQLLPINQNQALFSLLGTTYGGNGITTFALPDLRDRTVVGTSTSVTIGSQLGANFTTVTAAELPPSFTNTRDIFWHDASGADLVWALNQSEQIIGGPNLPTVPTSWSIAGVGDFNNDGISDLLWRDASGANQVWNMDITEQIGNGANLPTVPTSWSVAGIGNFVGNGLSDIVWHNANGQNLIWNVQNDALVNGASLPTTPGAWSLAGVGNFLGNGLKDLVWHNTQTGQNLIWNLQGDNFVNGASLPTTPTSWNIVGIGAFGGNGQSDILFHNASGQNLIWVVQNDQLVGGYSLPTTPTSWSVAGVGDFTGSGTDGILWHDASGATQIWNMQNFQLVSGANLPAPPPSWNISGVGINTVVSGLATAPSGDPSQMVQAMASFAPSGGSGAAGPIDQQPSDLNSQLVAPNSLH
jgi:microcystin-dependent protein